MVLLLLSQSFCNTVLAIYSKVNLELPFELNNLLFFILLKIRNSAS